MKRNPTSQYRDLLQVPLSQNLKIKILYSNPLVIANLAKPGNLGETGFLARNFSQPI